MGNLCTVEPPVRKQPPVTAAAAPAANKATTKTVSAPSPSCSVQAEPSRPLVAGASLSPHADDGADLTTVPQSPPRGSALHKDDAHPSPPSPNRVRTSDGSSAAAPTVVLAQSTIVSSSSDDDDEDHGSIARLREPIAAAAPEDRSSHQRDRQPARSSSIELLLSSETTSEPAPSSSMPEESLRFLRACDRGDLGAVENLLGALRGGADRAPTTANSTGEGVAVATATVPPTALHVASRSGNPHVVQALLDSGLGFDVNAPLGGDAYRPLFIAAYFNEVETVKLLLARGADPNACDAMGDSCLHIACHFGFEDIVSALLCYSECDLELRTADHRTALDVAADSRHAEICHLLVAAGADVTAVSIESQGFLRSQQLL